MINFARIFRLWVGKRAIKGLFVLRIAGEQSDGRNKEESYIIGTADGKHGAFA